MASTKISDLTAASTLAATDRIPVVQAVGAGPVRTTPEAIKTYIETGGIVTASDPVLDLTQTWNNAGVTFTGMKLNVTNTASASGSKLLDIQNSGTSLLRLTNENGGKLYVGSYFTVYGDNNVSVGINTSSILVGGYYGLQVWSGAGNYITATLTGTGVGIRTDGAFQWGVIGGGGGYTPDLYLYRDAANTLAQRNSTTAQVHRIYNTYTDSSNYERLSLIPGAASNWMQIKAETAGTGGDNLNIALTPSGTGGISAHVPDSGAGGGNTRGANAVDWQTYRTVATNVASGAQSVVAGGAENSATGQYSTASGGLGNVSSNSASTVGGGYVSSATGSRSTVAGGESNTASGYASTVAGGSSNTASGSYSWIPGGLDATTRGLAGAYAFGTVRRAALGDAQVMGMVLKGTTTDATPKVLTVDAGAAGSVNQMVLPNNSSLMFEIDVISHDSALKSASWKIQGTARRGANAAATSIVGANVTTVFGSDLVGAPTTAPTVTADTTNGAIAVTFTGIAATTIYTVAHVRIVQAA